MSSYRGYEGEPEGVKRIRLLRNWSAISKALRLDERSGEIADYDDELASIIVLTAQETRALFDDSYA